MWVGGRGRPFGIPFQGGGKGAHPKKSCCANPGEYTGLEGRRFGAERARVLAEVPDSTPPGLVADRRSEVLGRRQEGDMRCLRYLGFFTLRLQTPPLRFRGAGDQAL